MRKILSIITAFLTIISGFCFATFSSDDYQISEVPCTIDDFVYSDKMYLEISLPAGLEIPDEYTIYKETNGWTCELKNKILDGMLFSDSEGYPLTSFTIVATALDNTDSNSVTFIIKRITKVTKNDTIITSTVTTKFSYSNMQLNKANRPRLIVSSEEPHHGNIIFDIIFTQ